MFTPPNLSLLSSQKKMLKACIQYVMIRFLRLDGFTNAYGINNIPSLEAANMAIHECICCRTMDISTVNKLDEFDETNRISC